MGRRTILLFQLFLALFAVLAVLYDLPNKYMVVPLLCLLCMFLLGRHEADSSKNDQEKLVVDR